MKPIVALYKGKNTIRSQSLYYGEAFRPVVIDSDAITKAVEAMQSIQILRQLDMGARLKLDGFVQPVVIPSSLKLTEEMIRAHDKL